MRATAGVENGLGEHRAIVATIDSVRAIAIPPRESGYGSSAKLRFLALATCSCNGVSREGAKQGIAVERVRVEAAGEFGGPGEPAENATYRARITANASEEAIRALVTHSDTVAEIQNTLRAATPVVLAGFEAAVAGS